MGMPSIRFEDDGTVLTVWMSETAVDQWIRENNGGTLYGRRLKGWFTQTGMLTAQIDGGKVGLDNFNRAEIRRCFAWALDGRLDENHPAWQAACGDYL